MRIIAFLFALLLAVSTAHAETYMRADSRGENAPVKVSQDINGLVKYLTEPFDSDKQKARALLAWIVYHIDYDKAQAKSQDDRIYYTKTSKKNWSSDDIFETRTGMCGDIAKLYQKMLLMSGIDADVVSGRAKNDRHAWTAVKIDNKWLFVDPTWAMGGKIYIDDWEKQDSYGHKKMIKNRKNGNKEILKKRENRFIVDKWFLVSPRDMKQTHTPDDPRWLNP